MLPSSPRGKIQRHLTLHVAGNPTLTSSPRDLHPDIYLPIHVAGIPTLPTPPSQRCWQTRPSPSSPLGFHHDASFLSTWQHVATFPIHVASRRYAPFPSTWQSAAIFNLHVAGRTTLPSPPRGNQMLPLPSYKWQPPITLPYSLHVAGVLMDTSSDQCGRNTSFTLLLTRFADSAIVLYRRTPNRTDPNRTDFFQFTLSRISLVDQTMHLHKRYQ
eukprot:TRINITY_DN9636_c0_g1_i2.p1 TRINITY_DN9636_c0_g1~~TRINITY_DN9636_c0_g1_i2.p1  ORF type:complete len:215 (+),score=0.75 TRINITY_DN9636_c0_g1_i2:484-1128(+)